MAVALLTGATGFIGDALHNPLRDAGWSVRCMTRRTYEAESRWPDRTWVTGDAGDEASLARALEGCEVAYYLVHGMTQLTPGWVQREVKTAETFARLAGKAGVSRVVYLGGVAPQDFCSDHLRARLLTGEALRAGTARCLELRAAMIVGAKSASWMMVRDLAARLPAMVLPSWLKHRSEPVGIDDVVGALLAGARQPLDASDWRDLPGPEVLTGVEILKIAAGAMGRKPLLIPVPMVTPYLSSHWIRLVTRVDHRLAAELVEGLRSDLVATRPFWTEAKLSSPLPLRETARRALAAEAGQLPLRAQALEALAGFVTRNA